MSSEHKSKVGRRLLRTTTWPIEDPQNNGFRALALGQQLTFKLNRFRASEKLLVLIVRAAEGLSSFGMGSSLRR